MGADTDTAALPKQLSRFISAKRGESARPQPPFLIFRLEPKDALGNGPFCGAVLLMAARLEPI